jgi:hypothetical protein
MRRNEISNKFINFTSCPIKIHTIVNVTCLNIIIPNTPSKFSFCFHNHIYLIINLKKGKQFHFPYVKDHSIIVSHPARLDYKESPSYPFTSLHYFPFVCYKDRQFFTRHQIKLYVIQHILHFYWCHFCQSRTREGGIGLDVTPDLLRTKENNY